MLALEFLTVFGRGTGSMDNDSKLSKMLKTRRDPREVQDWIFSLTPLGVAFVFFFFLIMPMDIPDKSLVMVDLQGLAEKPCQHGAAGRARSGAYHGTGVVVPVTGLASPIGDL
jgi:hypothetical protein